MIAVLRTAWTVSLASYAEDNGIPEENVDWDLGNYLTSSINDLPAMEGSDAWATSTSDRPARMAGGVARVWVDWQVRVTREQWLAARGLPARGAARRDLLEYLARELYCLPSLCQTDAVMVVGYELGGRRLRREFRPADRFREDYRAFTGRPIDIGKGAQ